MGADLHRAASPSTLFYDRPVRAAVGVLALALLSFSAWRFEVEFLKGWRGLNWLHGYPWAAVPICVFVALSILTVGAEATLVHWRPAAFFTVFVAALGLLSFEIARRWFQEDQSWMSLVGERPPLSHWLFSPLLSVVITAVGVHQGLRRLGLAIAPWTVLLFFAASVLVWPFSLLSIKMVPAHGYGDAIHAVKAGYPAFWINVMLATAAAIAARLGRRRKR